MRTSSSSGSDPRAVADPGRAPGSGGTAAVVAVRVSPRHSSLLNMNRTSGSGS
jgi:hypothetical protein